jgi:hypothetical protein
VIAPCKTDSILVIDADAVLSMPASLEFLQSIAGRNSQIVRISGSIQQRKLSFRYAGWRRSASLSRSPDFRRLERGENLYHASMITASVNNVNRYDSLPGAVQTGGSAMLYSFAK